MNLPIALLGNRSVIQQSGSQQPGKKMEASLFSMSLAQSESALQALASAVPHKQENVSLESLLKTILHALDKEDQPLQKGDLVLPDVQALLAKLPSDLVHQIEQLFQSGTSVAEMIKSESPPTVKAITVLIHQFSKETQNTDPNKTSDPVKFEIPEIKKSIEHLFPILRDQKEVKSAKAILIGLIEQLHKQETKNGGKPFKALDLQTFFDKMERAVLKKELPVMPFQWNSTATKQTDRPVFSAAQTPAYMPPLEQFVLHAPRSGNSEAAQQQFVKEFQNIILSGKFAASSNGMTKLNIRLTPEHLGTLNIELISKNGELSARILTSSVGAKEMMESQIHVLKNALHGNSIQLDRIVVLEQPQEQKFQQQDTNPQPHQQHQHQQQPQDDGVQDELFSDLLDELESGE